MNAQRADARMSPSSPDKVGGSSVTIKYHVDSFHKVL